MSFEVWMDWRVISTECAIGYEVMDYEDVSQCRCRVIQNIHACEDIRVKSHL
jgi:hypothetical protein